MKLKLTLLALVATLFAGCSSMDSSVSDATESATIAGVKHCVTSKDALPKGTKAIRLSDSAVTTLDTNGCYDFPARTTATGIAARVMDATDSVQLYNDSALFAVTLPYVSAGDTINVVPTIVTLQNAPNTEVDSVFLVVYEKTHILSRLVKLRKVNYGDSSSYSRTLWNRDGGPNILVHFQFDGKTKFASTVYTAEPGGIVERNWNQIVAAPGMSVVHDSGSFVDYRNGNSYKSENVDTIVDTSVKTVKLTGKAKSIYGISKINYNGLDSLDVSTLIGERLVVVTLTDSAGYSITDTMKVIRGYKFVCS